MNSHNFKDDIDALLWEGLRPYAEVVPPEAAAIRLWAQLQQPSRPRWQRLLGRLGLYQGHMPVLLDVSELFPYEARELAFTGLLQNQRRLTLLMA